MCSLSNTDSQQLNLATSSGFWQQLPSEKANETRPQTCSLSNTDSQQLSPAAGGTWSSGIASAPYAEGLGCSLQSVHACRELFIGAFAQTWQTLLRFLAQHLPGVTL